MPRPTQWLALLSLVIAAHGATAQRTLRGTLRDSSLATPLAGAVITIVDSSGVTAARTISDAAGGFALTVPPRASTLHLIRIGYRPRNIPIGGATSSLELGMTRIPPILDAVRVSDKELCPGSADRGPAFQYWEQARAGLLAEVVAREANPATVTMMTYERHEHLGDAMVRRQTAQSRTGPSKRPFVAAASPSTFAKLGYMLESGNDRVFSAPDADVLLDESFAATHCFHLQTADAAHGGQIGLAFTPVPGRPDTLVDVAGTTWLDRSNPSLRSFDFHYTNLEPAAARVPTGGHLEFRSVANGVSFIERWSVRLAVLGSGPRTRPSVGIRRVSRLDRDDLVAQEVQENGGQVLEAAWLDGTMWRDSSTAIKGTIVQRGDGRPIAHAIVKLLGTQDTVETDDRGAFVLSPVVPGKYMIEVVDTTLAAFAAPRTQSREIEVPRGKTADFRASLAPAGDVILRLCKDSPSERLTTIVVGRIALPKAVSPDAVVIQATWQADFSGYYGVGVNIETAMRTISVDAAGRFAICKVSVDRPLKLKLSIAGVVADTIVKPPEGPYTFIDWRPWQ